MRRLGHRGGAALLLVLVAISGLAALVAGAFPLARSASRSGLGAVARVQARAAAETAITDAMLGWEAVDSPAIPGEERQLARHWLPGPVLSTAVVRNLGGPVFSLRGTGVRRDGSGSAIGFAQLELLVVLDSGFPGRVRPRPYPGGWRILP